MDVRSEIIREFAEKLSEEGSCKPDFIAHLCDLIKAGNGVPREKLMLLVQEAAHDHH